MHINVSYINSVDHNLTFVVIVVAEKQIYKRRFTRAGRSDDSDYITRLDYKIYVFKRLFRSVKGEVYVLKLDPSAEVNVCHSLSEIMLRLGVKNVHDPFKGCHRVLHRIGKICKEVYGAVEHTCVRNERNEKTDRY